MAVVFFLIGYFKGALHGGWKIQSENLDFKVSVDGFGD
jgi:hypothetical protein